MNEMKQLMTELTDRLRKTNEYNQYINVLSRLKQDSADLQENGLANEFFAAEHQYIAMVKELQEQFLEGSAVETSFLEG